MKNALEKDIWRDIKKSKGRFLSILFIVALGVAFFSGVKAGPIVMKNTADKYFDEYNLMDIRVLSTLGLTDKDVKEIEKIDGVEGIFPTYSMDVITDYNSRENVLKVHALPLDAIKNNEKDYINKVKLVEGRLPQKSGECVIEESKIKSLDIPIGTKINIKSGTDKSLDDKLKTTEYKIVGVIQTPYYLSFEKGSSNIGSGNIDGIIMIPQDDFKMDAYTEMFLTVNDAKEQNTFKSEYFNIVGNVTDKIEDISGQRIEARYDEIIDKANEEFEKGKKEFEDKKNEVNEKLINGQSEIDKYKEQIVEAQKTLKNKKIETQNKIANGKKQIEEGQKQLQLGYDEYNKAVNSFNENKKIAYEEFKKAEINLENINNQIQLINSEISNLQSKLNDETLNEEERVIIQQEIVSKSGVVAQIKDQYEGGIKELNSKKQQLEQSESKLISTKLTLDATKTKLENEKSNLIKNEELAKKEFIKGEKELIKQDVKIKEAENELEKSKIKAKDELKKAENKLKDAEDEISKIEKPEWYILDRDSHYSYAEYKSCANSVDAISKIFPVFFFSVAALVCLTTMTRMVDEQRINIGTLKALGYSTAKISKKYIVYALSASILGSILGLMIGFTVFPLVIFNAYGMMFTLPSIILTFDIKIALGVTLTSILITTLAAYLACYKELKETPSVLMRPRAPKNGKRIILEKIPFIWNRISFIGKVTVRNIFRYKKRFLMTVLGIAGCTALILTALGIRDSIQMIVDGQYGSIFKYDMTVTLDNNLELSKLDKVEEIISKDNRVSKYQLMNYENGKVTINNKEKDITIVVPKDIDGMKEFIHLKERKSQKPINLGKNGIILSEKIARNLGVKDGDKIELINSKDKKVKVEVIGICENYVSHYAYMSKEYYNDLFNREVNYNRAIGNVKDTSNDAETNIAEDFVKENEIKGVSFNTGIRENFSNTIKSLNYVVLIMTISAGTLAFIVLYNLTNVNISERIREIATIKVLGFYDNEVAAYIYRENIILTVIGTMVGLGLGMMLHQFIMVTVELESMMFGRIISLNSYIIAALMTIVLGVIVNVAMYYKLRKVKMVESLKSVD